MDLPTAVHVGGGALGLLAGATALALRKGGHSHKQAGYVFVIAMVTMAATGGVISYAAGKPFDVLSSWLTCYMVLTGWIAFQHPAKRVSIGLMCAAGAGFAGYLSVELYAVVTGVRATDAPIGTGYIFATILGLALLGDYRLLTRAYLPRQRKIRHLWRMNFGLFVATGSFFGARPHLFAEWMQTSGLLLLLATAPILVMVYWCFKLRLQTASEA